MHGQNRYAPAAEEKVVTNCDIDEKQLVLVGYSTTIGAAASQAPNGGFDLGLQIPTTTKPATLFLAPKRPSNAVSLENASTSIVIPYWVVKPTHDEKKANMVKESIEMLVSVTPSVSPKLRSTPATNTTPY